MTFTATVTDTSGGGMVLIPAGTVTFFDGTTQLGTGMLTALAGSNPTATFTTSALAPGTHQITASYSGGTNFLSSTSGPLTQT